MSIYCQTILNRPSDWARKITNSKFSNLYVLNDSIYRCEQPDSLGFTIIDSIGIKSVLNLRSNHTDNEHIYRLPLNLYNIEMVPYDIGDEEIVKVLRILENSPKPIVVHCYYGSDRTGVVIAMYRIIFQNWTKEKALNEMKDGGYGFHNIYINIPLYIKEVDIERIKKEILIQN
jgi:protein tyrosine/serine phosphatase